MPILHNYTFMKIALPFLFLFLISDVASAQLISWRDLVEGDLPQPDERFHYGTWEHAFGELWLPDEEAHTAVILFHGGCWMDIYPGVEIMNHMAAALRDEGFVVWNVEYTRLGQESGGYPGTFRSAIFGADSFNRVAANHNIRTDRVIVAGHSAGGHLATWLAARHNLPEESALNLDIYGELQQKIEIHGVISLAGINDLERYNNYGATLCGQNTIERLIDYENRGSEAYSDTSPAELLPLGVPFVEVSAVFDAPVPPFFGYHFANKARDAGDDVTHIVQQDAGHFEMIAPWSDQWTEILNLFLNLLD